MTTVTRHPGVVASTGTGPRLTQMKNVVNNPRAATVTSWATTFGAGGNGTTAAITSGGPLSICPSFYRSTFTAAPTSVGGIQIRITGPDLNLVSPSKPYSFKVWARSSVAITMQAKAGWYNGSTYVSSIAGPEVPLAPNTWKQLSFEGVSPATATRVQINVDPGATSAPPSAGANLDVTGWFVHEKLSAGEGSVLYADGDSVGWSWLGAPHASPSQGYGAVVG